MKINTEKLKADILELPSKLKIFIKTIYDLPHSGKYMLLSLFLFIFFLIISFPYDYIIKKNIYGLEGKSFRSIEISGFDFSLFSETYFDNINIVLNSGDEISCKNSIVNIALNPFTLFIKKKLKSDFQFDSLKYTGKEFELIFNINGNIDITLDKQTGLPKDGPVKIILSDSFINLNSINIPGPMGPLPLKVESVNIQSGNIDALIINGTVKINTFKLTGNDISCDVSGNIELNNNSKLDLTINIDSESAFLDQYKDILNSFIKNNILSLKIKGTLSKPELTLNSAGKNEN